ncbi:hypothetical protein C8J55DRAFT_606699 [Lentinula edodes]|uniref:Uncharacterized protein n=1 Tax=Lentinula lateritia TaxID=40482 RepID=A0A9W9AB60_9AGAR|nr:hypothetical protein C8J55DRAFT_606699 [Lentinula edodes]
MNRVESKNSARFLGEFHKNDTPKAADRKPHPQLIAEAIVAFQDVNARRRAAQLIPGLIMVGTSPSFSRSQLGANFICKTWMFARARILAGERCPGTETQSAALQVLVKNSGFTDVTRCGVSGTVPSTPTIVTGHVPDIIHPDCRFSEDMKPSDNRRAILQCYEASKKFAV